MKYKSQDASYMKPKKEYIYKNDINPDYSWSIIRKHIYLNDLYDYIILAYKGQTIERGYGNLNSPIVIVVENLNENTVKLLRLVFKKIIDINSIYITSYNKVVADKSVLDDLLDKELSAINPQVVLTLGQFNITNQNVLDIPSDVINNILEYDIRLNPKAILTDELKNTLIESQRALLKKCKMLIRYKEQ